MAISGMWVTAPRQERRKDRRIHRKLCNCNNKIRHLQGREIKVEFLVMSTNAFGSPLMVQLSPHNRHVSLRTLQKKSRDRWIRL
jgi:hypothetical protein